MGKKWENLKGAARFSVRSRTRAAFKKGSPRQPCFS